MKKLVILTIISLSCGLVHALPVGNPTEASLFTNGTFFDPVYNSSCCDTSFCWSKLFSLRIGFYGDYVLNRHLEVNNVNIDKDIEVTKIHTNAGYLAFNILNRADFFTTLGTSRFSIMANSKAWGHQGSQGNLGILNNIEFLTDFSWSVGGRVTLLNFQHFGVGIEGQYFQTRPKLSYITHVPNIFGPGQILYFDDNKNRYFEWQVGLGASYRIATDVYAFIPYVAAKWAESRFNINVPLQGTDLLINNLKSKKHWGYAVGISLTLYDMIGVTVEGRFADEKAIYVNGEFRF